MPCRPVQLALTSAVLSILHFSTPAEAATCTSSACPTLYKGRRPFYSPPSWKDCDDDATAAYLSEADEAKQPNGFPYTVPPGAASVLPSSTSNMLLTLRRITADCGAVVVARSYGGHAWEGVMPLPVQPTCGESVACTIEVRPGDDTMGFRVDAVVQDAVPTTAAAASRLLIQGSFGPTRASIFDALNLTNNDNESEEDHTVAAAWVQTQIHDVPASLLRAHYRKRANPRVVHDAFAGGVRGPCAKGSRWNRFAFDRHDIGRVLKITSDSLLGRFSLEASGVIRSESANVFGSAWPPVCRCKAGSSCSSDDYHTEWCEVDSILSCSDAVGDDLEAWSEAVCVPTPPEAGAKHILLRQNVECDKSKGEINFNEQTSVEACAQRCRDHPTCQYFIFGVDSKHGRCYMEDVSDDDCGPDGFQDDSYDFYKLDDGTITSNSDQLARAFPIEFVICDVTERIDGPIHLAEVGKATCDDDDADEVHVKNPPIDFAQVHSESTQVYSSDALTLVPVWIVDAVAMSTTPPQCKGTRQGSKSFLGVQKAGTTDVGNVTFYQYDRRLTLLDNTLEAPASVDVAASGSVHFGGVLRDEVCPVVPRTFVNEASCVQRRGSVCGTKSFQAATTYVTLNSQTFADWYANDKKHVHAVRGLRLEKFEDGNTNDPTETWLPPCTPGESTRWVRTEASGGCPTQSPWNSATSATIAAALVDVTKTADTANPLVRDVMVRELKSVLIQEDVECETNVGERWLSDSVKSLAECAELCRLRDDGCKYFLYGKNDRVGLCYKEDVQADDCGPEGFQIDSNYDFYKLDDSGGDSCNMTPADDLVGGSVEIVVADTAAIECWTHSHPHEYSIFDFSRWAGMHPGNEDAMDAGRRNPIMRFAEEGLAQIWFPSWHTMSRWNERVQSWSIQANIVSVSGAKFMDAVDIVDLPPNLRTEGLIAEVGATYEYPEDVVGFEACGSRGEVANDPELANKFYAVDDDYGGQGVDQEQYRYEVGKSMVWATVVLGAPDQLRQRTAWALSQVFVAGVPNFGYEDYTETWLNYYDIFVHNAFGNFRDVIREVSASPLMGEYLTYRGNSGFAYSGGKFPDENFARELMQLFTMGLWELNMDGTYKAHEETGGLIPTYSSANIRDFAKVWTGFEHQAARSNLEHLDDDDENVIDSMKLLPLRRDRFAKTVLGDDQGHLGDSYPLCSELPPRHFLRKGATYRYHGSASMYGSEMDGLEEAGTTRKHFTPDSQNSDLYAVLCRSNADDSKCTFPSVVVLKEDVGCYGVAECNAETVHAVKIVDESTGATGFYTYVEPPCVHLQFFNGKVAKFADEQACANPTRAATVGVRCCQAYDPADYCPASHPVYESHTGSDDHGDVCRDKFREFVCPTGCTRTDDWSSPYCTRTDAPLEPCHLELGSIVSAGKEECLFLAEAVRFSTAEERCAATYEGGIVCPRQAVDAVDDEEEDTGAAWLSTCSRYQYAWVDEPCKLRLQVYPSGLVGVIDTKAAHHVDYLEPSSGNTFQVKWEATTTSTEPTADGDADDVLFPLYAEGCADGCVPVSERSGSCICDIVVVDAPVVAHANGGGSTLPSPAALRAALTVGAFPPESYSGSSSSYTLCTSAFCTSQPGVKVHVRGADSQPTTLDMHTIFELADGGTTTARPSSRNRAKYLLNRRSVVEVGKPEYSYSLIEPKMVPVSGCAASSEKDGDECFEAFDDSSNSHYSNETGLVGSWLRADFAAGTPVAVDRIGFSQVSDERRRPSRVLFEFSDGSSHSATLVNEMGFNTIALPNGVETSFVKMTVEAMHGDPCIFPFSYRGATFNECTTSGDSRYWCATQVDANGVVVEERDCVHGVREMRFYPPGAADTTSVTPCEDVGLLAVEQSECEEAAAHLIPEGYAVDSRHGLANLGEWRDSPVGCSVEAGSVSESDGRYDGDWEPYWNLRAVSYDWSTSMFPVCKTPSAHHGGGGGGGFRFRNPPHFVANTAETTWMPGTNYWVESTRAILPFGDGDHLLASAEHETEALIDHVFGHANVPPFVAHKLIQRMVTSNPSPRYVHAVATAFAEGAHGGKTFSGKYGDLEATITAVLTDREARSTELDLDPSFGQIREPLLKVLHLMRAMEFQSKDGREVAFEWMEAKIGQMVFASPSVFSFFLPAFAPDGPVARAGLVAPEAQIATAPYLIGYLNGITALIDNGLSQCEAGFGGYRRGTWCGYSKEILKTYTEGNLQFTLADPSNPQGAVDELALLLTGGRMSEHTRGVLLDVYTHIVAEAPFEMAAAVAKLKGAALGEADCMSGVKALLNFPVPIEVQSCAASSTADEEDHGCATAHDGDYDRGGWEADREETGGWLSFTFAAERTVGRVAFAIDCGTRRARPKQISLRFGNGDAITVELDEAQASCEEDRAVVTLAAPVTAQSVNVTFETNHPTPSCVFPFVYQGQTYTSCTDFEHYGFWCAVRVNEDTLVEEDWGDCASAVSTNIVANLELHEIQMYEPGDVPIDVLSNEYELEIRNYSSKPAGCSVRAPRSWESGYRAYYNHDSVGCDSPACDGATVVFGGPIDEQVWVTATDSIQNSESTLHGWGAVDGRISDSRDEMISSSVETSPWWQIYLGKEAVAVSSLTLYPPSNWGASDNDGLSVYVDEVRCAADVGPFEEGIPLRVPCRGVGNNVRIVLPGPERRLRFSEVQVNVVQQPNAGGSYVANAAAEALALRQTLKVLALSAPEWHTTNNNAASAKPRAQLVPQATQNRKFKAVVVVFLGGGADSFNMVMPHSQCTTDGNSTGGGTGRVPFDYYTEYAEVRGNDPANHMALRREQLLPIEMGTSSTHQTELVDQPCKTFGLHPNLLHLKQLYDAGDLAVLANVGPLVEPASRQDWWDRNKRDAKAFPIGVGGHNTMTKDTVSVQSGYRDAKGVLGRITSVLTSKDRPPETPAMKSQLFSLDGYAPIFDGSPLSPTIIGRDGLVRFRNFNTVADEMKEMAAFESESMFGETITQSMQEAIQSTETLGAYLDNTTLNSGTVFPDSSFSRQLSEVAKLIHLNKNTFETERSAFYTATGGYDTHATVDISELMTNLNDGLEAFTKEMKEQNLWDDVTVVVASEFGRTLAPNSQGADHGWGGNYFVLGGDVNGRQMLGKFPERLAEYESDLNLGRGIYLPTTPWEAVWSPVAQWLGVDNQDELKEVLPNLANFPPETIITKDQLFGGGGGGSP